MILWIIKWIFISTLLISLIHYLFSFFENILSVPKMKDLQKPYPRHNDVPISIPAPTPTQSPIAIENTNPLITNTNTNINKNMETELEEYLKDITKQKTI